MKLTYSNITILMSALIVNSVFAAEYYVSNTGSATWPDCTNINTPCSLQDGAENADEGDTVYLRGGTYTLQEMTIVPGSYWNIAFTPANSGSSGNPITFQAYPGETVFFDNSNNAGKSSAVASYGVFSATGYIVFDGIDTATAMSNGQGRAVLVKGTNNVTIKNAEIQGGSGGTTNNNCIRLEGASNITVENCRLWNSTGNSTNSSGVTLYGVSNSTIKNCTIHDNVAGIRDKAGSENNTYTFNFVHSNTTAGYALATETAVHPDPHDLRLSRNIFASNSRDMDISGNQTKRNVIVDNNTFYGSGGGVYFWLNNGIDGLDVYNNIFHSKSPATRYEDSTDLYSDYNNFYNSTGADSGANSITSDPNLVNPGGASPEDYKRTSYPTDGRGGSYPSVMGAYITGSETIGYTSGNTIFTTWYEDADGDGYHASNTQIADIDPGADWYELSSLTGGGDCDDTDTDINPGAIEVCGNAVDEDCSGVANGCSSGPIISNSSPDGVLTCW